MNVSSLQLKKNLRKKRNSYKAIALAAILLSINCFLMSCADNNEIPSAADKDISLTTPSHLEIGFVGGGNVIEFATQASWWVASDATWIKFMSPIQGKGNALISLEIDENNESSTRTAEITVTVGDIKKKITVAQSSFSIGDGTNPSLLYTESELLAIKAIIDKGESASVTTTFNNLIEKCTEALAHTAVPYTETDPTIFHDKLLQPAAWTRDLAMAYWFTGDEKYAKKAIEIIKAWAQSTVNVQYDQGKAGAGMYIIRSIYPMVCAYDMLVNKNVADEETKEAILKWFGRLEEHSKTSIQIWEDNDYFNKQYYQNHMVAHSMGMMMLGFVTNDQQKVKFALNSTENPRDLYELIQGSIFMKGDEPCTNEEKNTNIPKPIPPVETGEIYDRYRHGDTPRKGLQYAHLTQSLLATMARMCHNNGLDMFAYTAPTGENLRFTYEYYSDFYRLKDSSIKSGFYVEETERMGIAGDLPGTYELGLRYYPNSQPIKDFIASDMYVQGYSNTRESYYYHSLGFTRFLSAIIDK